MGFVHRTPTGEDVEITIEAYDEADASSPERKPGPSLDHVEVCRLHRSNRLVSLAHVRRRHGALPFPSVRQ
jgi:hypothetical protein